ncbi:hypothetical protein TRIUR3_25458 [Triticum urartu]|uniref:Myb/SANT-like domain-containing protein n=1 Tax=Triticum urartu TaxID=4572 RepID=M8ALI9_TRIUA|nr:hypothetical protein TRIUR3_25458 [Triticum urartu]
MANRARWVMKFEKGLIDILHENNNSHYRTPNGWRSEGWKKIVKDFNDRHPDAGFTKVQIQEHETQLKKDYKLIKSILQRDGVSWDQNASMIRTTDEIWDEIIDESPKARKYQRDIPEGVGNIDEEDNNTSTLRSMSRRLSALVPGSIDEGENNISALQRTLELGSQGLEDVDLLQNHDEEALERPQPGADPKPQQRADEPAQSSSCIEPQKDKRKKRKASDIQQTMEAYLDFRMKQARTKEQTKKDGEQFSISRCIKALQSMTDVSDQVRVLAADVFKDSVNREIFLSYEPRLRALWLKREVNRSLHQQKEGGVTLATGI